MLLNYLAEKSPLSFEIYMEICLFHPEYGYYAKGNLPGKQGDYLTSPCIHKVFGATIANQIIEIYEILKRPQNFTIVEAGAGQGYLALDILEYLYKKGFNFRYVIVEPFPCIQAIQEKVLSNVKLQVNWVKDLTELTEFEGVFVSNELFDSFPVKVIKKQDLKLKEVWLEVGKNGNIKEFTKEVEDEEIIKRINPFFKYWINDYQTEVCTKIEKFYKNLSQKLKKGFIITIDYGYPRPDYYAPERFKGTLLCYYKNKAIDNFYFKPGEMDITSHVDFTLIKEVGEKYGFFTIGFTQQGSFLVSLGIERILCEVSEKSWKDIEALKFLVFPQGFGSSHWVLIQARFEHKNINLKGFQLSNRIHLLS